MKLKTSLGQQTIPKQFMALSSHKMWHLATQGDACRMMKGLVKEEGFMEQEAVESWSLGNEFNP